MTATLHAQYLTYGGANAKGTITIGTNTADQQLRDPDGDVIYTGPRKYRLVAGELDIELPPTDGDFAETGWTYWARIELDGAPPALRWFELPDGETVELADIVGELAPSDPLTHPIQYQVDAAETAATSAAESAAEAAYVVGLTGADAGQVKVVPATGNDLTAIHAARDAAAAFGGVVFIDDALTVSGVVNATVAGQEWRFGPSASITLANGANSDAIYIQADGVTLIDPVIDGNASNQTSGAGGILLGSGVDDVTIVRPVISDTRSVGINAQGNRLTVIDGDFSDTGDAAIAITAPAASNRFSCRVTGNRIRQTANGPYGIRIHGTNAGSDGVHRSIVTDNDVELPSHTSAGLGIEVWGVSPRSIIANNQITGSNIGISVSTSDDTVVSGNTVKGSFYIGVEVANSNNVAVSDNVVDGNAVTQRLFSLSNTPVTNVSCSGNIGRNWKNAASCYGLYASQVDGLTWTGGMLRGPIEPVTLANCTNFNISGTILDGGGGAYDAINLNTCTEGSVTSCLFLGVGRSGVIVYSGAMTGITIGPNIVPSGMPQVFTGAVALGARSVVRGGYGTTAQRYIAAEAGVGGEYFDTTLGKPLYSNGTNWKYYADDTNA